jgi:putative acetyltransferase
VGGLLDDVRAEAVLFEEGEGLFEGAGSGGGGVVDEGLVAKGCGGDGALPGARMVGGEDDNEGLGDEGGDGEAVGGVAVAEDAGVEGAVLEALNDLGGEGFVEVEMDARVRPAIGAEDGGQGAEHGGADEADVERAELAAADGAGFVEVALDVAEGAPGAVEKGSARGGEADGARGAEEERRAEYLFELADLLRERGLGEVEAQGGASEVKLFGDGYEVAEVAKLDVFVHGFSIDMQQILIERNKILDVSPGCAETLLQEEWTMIEAGTEIEIRALAEGEDGTAFRTLNEEWITRYFALEASDRKTLENPGAILAKGGRILMVYVDGAAVGCVALIAMGDGLYELSKMAVSPELRGLGIGRKLILYAIAQAREMGVVRLFLGSNSKLANAVHLYESVGFVHVPAERLPNMGYARADVFMEMML